MISRCSKKSLVCLVVLISLTGISDALGQSASPEVTVVGNISSHSITMDELLRFTLTFKNKTAFALRSVRLIAPPDSYQFGQVCVLAAQGAINCYGSQDFSSSKNMLVATIAPEQNFTAWGYLKPTSTHKPAMLALIVGWNLPSGSTSSASSLVVNVGENQVLDWYQAAWLDNLVKILAIPIALVIIGFLLNLIAKKSDERKAQAEKKREEIRQQAQQEQSLRAETWEQMLPVSHKYAAQLYLPLSSAAERLGKTLQDSNKELASFYVLLVWKRMAETRRKIGGFYFKDLRGETLAAECWNRLRLALLGREDAPFNLAVKASVTLLDPTETYQTFEKRFGDKRGPSIRFLEDNIQHGWELFQDWMKRRSRVSYVTKHISCFCAVLDYESNRPYKYWYDLPKPLGATQDIEQLLVRILRKTASESKFTNRQIEEYFEEAHRS